MRTNYYLLLIILFLTITNVSALNYNHRASGTYWDKTMQSDEINYAVNISIDSYDMYYLPSEISSMRSGGTDYITLGINYAHNKGIRYIIRIPEGNYDPSLSWANFVLNSTAQSKFISDFTWILQNHQGLDGIEVEEAEGFGTSNTTLQQTWRTFKNGFLLQEKNIVLTYHPNYDNGNFAWGLNMGNSWITTQSELGYDFNNITSNHLVNFVAPQINQYTLQQYQDRLNEVNNQFSGSGISIMPYAYIYVPDTAWNANNCNAALKVACFNQYFFDAIRYDLNQGSTPAVFTLGRLRAYPRSWWPNETTPGAYAGDIIKNVWGSISPVVLTPTFSPGSGAYSSNQTVYITSGTSGAIIRYTLDGSVPTTSSTLYSVALNISTTTTINAKGWKAGYTDSAVSSASYIFGSGSVAEPNLSDNNIKKSEPNTLFNSVTFMEAGCLSNCTTNIYRSLLRMNISNFTVSNAPFTLKLLWYFPSSGITNPITIEVYKPTKTWQTACTTWNNYTCSLPWSNAGGDWIDSLGVTQGTTPYASITLSIGSPDNLYHSFNVTQIVLDALNSGSKNVSFLIKANTTNEGHVGDYVAFRGLDWTNSLETPQLIGSNNIPPSAPIFSSWGNNRTNNNSIDLAVLLLNSSVNFNATTNQSVTWNWYVDDNLTGGNFNNLSVSWLSGGSKTVQVLVNNSNGSAILTWNVQVISPMVPPTPINVNISSGKYWANASWLSGSGNVTDSYIIVFHLNNLENNTLLQFSVPSSNNSYNLTGLYTYKYYLVSVSVAAYNNTNTYSNYNNSNTINLPPYLVYVASQTNPYYNLTGSPSKSYTIRTRAYNSTYGLYSDWAESTVTLADESIVSQFTRTIFGAWE